ncbi:MAG: type II secretion system F family protein, partial [Planctomycetes bacterium]|nr:type II secretion system F family protein [Planctomycetota bacterium]
LAERMQRGESLSDILEKEPQHFPPVYRAVVLAGIRAGRLPAALESVSRSARRLAETRRMTAAGFLYPLLVLLLAWTLFAGFITWVFPVVYEFAVELDAPGRVWFSYLAGMGKSVAIWGPGVPLVVVLLAAIWWFRSGRATLVQPQRSVVTLGWLPWLGRMLRWYRIATFSEVLTLLIENRVPLPQSVVLAAEATGDPGMIRAALEIAGALRRGEPLQLRGPFSTAFPPLLEWLMITGQNHGALLPALRHASEIYQRRAQNQADVARIFLPVLLTVVIGGFVTLTYTLMLFGPWTIVLRAMSRI